MINFLEKFYTTGKETNKQTNPPIALFKEKLYQALRLF